MGRLPPASPLPVCMAVPCQGWIWLSHQLGRGLGHHMSGHCPPSSPCSVGDMPHLPPSSRMLPHTGPSRGYHLSCQSLVLWKGHPAGQGDAHIHSRPAGTISPLPPTSSPSPRLGPPTSPTPLPGAPALLPAVGQGLVAASCQCERHPLGTGPDSQPPRLSDRVPDPQPRRAPSAGLGGRWVPSIPPVPMGGRGVKPAKRREK